MGSSKAVAPLIRDSVSGDMRALEALYPAAFPEEDLLALVRSLLIRGNDVVSLVAESEGRVAGHVCFTSCVAGPDDSKVWLLGPLGVNPDVQKLGIGSALVREGLNRARVAGIAGVLVLGDPGYYGRFGFREAKGVSTPYPIPDDWRAAWQFLETSDGSREPVGMLRVPEPWQDRALW